MYRLLIILIATAGLITGCGKQSAESTATAAPATAPANALPAGLVVDSIPGDAVGPAAIKASAKAGDTVVMTGHIAGRAEPFVTGRAMFILVDTALPLCTDGCPAPQDLCCETPEDIHANASTVQVLDASGKPFKVSLKGHGGLAAAQKVVVAGVIAQNDDQGFVVSARQIALANE